MRATAWLVLLVLAWGWNNSGFAAEPEWRWMETEGQFDGPVDSAAFSADGKLVAAGSGDRLCVWSVETGKMVTRMQCPAPQRQFKLAFTADGKTLAVDGVTDPLQRFFDLKTGKQIREKERSDWFEIPGKPYTSKVLAFSPDASIFVETIYSPAYSFRFVETATGKDRVVSLGSSSRIFPYCAMAFSPDGKTFAVNGPLNQLRIFDTASGKLRREIRPPVERSDTFLGRTPHIRYSPDGQILFASEQIPGPRSRYADSHRIVLWHVETAQVYWLPTKDNLVPDPILQLPGVIGPGNRYWMTETKQVFDLLNEEVVPIAKAPDARTSRRLVGASADGTVLAFAGNPSGVQPHLGKTAIYLSPAPVLAPPVPPGAEIAGELADAVWKGATAENGFRRDYFAKVLAAKPEVAVQIAKAKLKPVTAEDADRVSKWLKDFDNDDSDVRDKAQDELQAVAHQFSTALAEALKTAPAGELRNRLRSITRTMAETPAPPSLLADLRAIEFLKRLGTPAATDLLKAIAAGMPGARLTTAAEAALAR